MMCFIILGEKDFKKSNLEYLDKYQVRNGKEIETKDEILVES